MFSLPANCIRLLPPSLSPNIIPLVIIFLSYALGPKRVFLFGLILRASYPYGITNLTFVEGLAFILWKAHVHVSTCHKQQASVADTNNIGR